MELPTEEDDGEILDLAGLDEGHGLEQFIEGAESARNDDKGVGVFDQQGLADEEVADVDPLIEVGVVTLFHGQHDIAAHGTPTDLLGPPVGRFHEAGSAPGHDGESELGDLRGQAPSQVVVGVGFRKPG